MECGSLLAEAALRQLRSRGRARSVAACSRRRGAARKTSGVASPPGVTVCQQHVEFRRKVCRA